MQYFFRTLAFFVGYVISTLVWGSLSVLVGWMLPYHVRFYFIIVIWTRIILLWLGFTCNVRINVEGLELIPAGGCVVLCKHESTLETLFLQDLFAPVTTVIKRELLFIPFFGWAYALLRPIAIDRKKRTFALEEVMRQGKKRLADGINVALFPEGSRTEGGHLGVFQRGAAALAIAANVPVVPVCHNSGQCWRAHQFLKQPGQVTFVIGQPIAVAGKKPSEVSDEARNWMSDVMRERNWLR